MTSIKHHLHISLSLLAGLVALAALLMVTIGSVKQSVRGIAVQPSQASTSTAERLLSDLIRVTTPAENEEIGSPLNVTGAARGMWFFEASFPVVLFDEAGKQIASAPAQALSEWMTTDFVPFQVKLIFSPPKSGRGTLVFFKDNPSGLPESAHEYRLPVRFSRAQARQVECRPSGCSGQICSDTDMISTCEFLPEYACYREARCERKATGRCGWAETPELKQCIEKARTGRG